jgi:hypothetical protein
MWCISVDVYAFPFAVLVNYVFAVVDASPYVSFCCLFVM